MDILGKLRGLTPQQRSAVLASFLGWILDAFDFVWSSSSRASPTTSTPTSANRAHHESAIGAIRGQCRLFIYVVVLMTAFNFLSHGTQDLYPTFLQVQHHLSTHAVGIIAVIYNIGDILGGIFFGAFSETIGRRNAIVLAAVLVLPTIPIWAFAHSVVRTWPCRRRRPRRAVALITWFGRGAKGVPLGAQPTRRA